MSIIRKIKGNAIFSAGKRMSQVICCLLALLATYAAAQCDFRENGYFFKHPHFGKVNWLATLDQTDLTPAELLCTAKPVRLSFQQLPQNAAMVYTSAPGTWNLVNASLVNNTCICCLPVKLTYSEPVAIAVPAGVSLDTALPFHVLTRNISQSDTTLFAAVGKNGKIYCLNVVTASGKVISTDSITINLTAQQTIGGVWGEPDGAGIDTALWIAGSSGLVRLLSFKNNQWGTAQTLTIGNSETVTSIGGGFAGTASGKIYRRSGASFTLENSAASSPIRSIDSRIAVGDAGTVLIRQAGAWRSSAIGTTNYRAGNLTGNVQGTAVELLDDKWNYSVHSFFDSTTRISSVQPSDVGAKLNSGVYRFNINGTQTITVNLRDPDDNRTVPDIKIRKQSGGVVSLTPTSVITSLLGHNPSAVCATTQAYFNDTLVKVILTRSIVSFEANSTRGNYDASCGIWKWQLGKYAAQGYWGSNDTAMVISGKDTLKIANFDSGFVTIIRQDVSDAKQHGWFFSATEGRIRLAPGASTALRSISVVDITGREVWRRQSGFAMSGAISPRLPSGVLLVRVESMNGSAEVKKVNVTGR